MKTELIKLKVKKEASRGKTAQSIVDKFIESCLALDASIFEPMIDEDQYFEELDKYRFLASLKQQFDWAVARGAKDITMKKGKCGLCIIGHSTYEFYINQNTLEFAYIVNTEKNRVKDIFVCNYSSGRGQAN